MLPKQKCIIKYKIIDKFVDTMNGFACIRIVGGLSPLLTFIFMTWYPNFQLYIMYSVKFGINFLRVAVFVKIPFQHINNPYMLGVCRRIFMKFKDR